MSSSKLYKTLPNCAKCHRSKEDGVAFKLMQCKACGIEVYCSKDCQKADWPSHKTKCSFNQETRRRLAAQPQGTQQFDALSRWSHFHRPTLQLLSSQELGVFSDPSKGAHTFFAVCVQARPQETSERKKFEIVQAAPYPIARFKNIEPQIRQAYDGARATHSTLNLNTYLMMIWCRGTSTPHIVPIGFQIGSLPLPYQPPTAIIGIINSGEVC